jgi:trehalose 6-phosphate phosphatase
VKALRVIARAVEGLTEPVRVVGGKYVVNLMPTNAPHKGTALHALACQEGANHVIYVGDDETDEDVFMYRGTAKLLGVRVGKRLSSAATHFVQDQGCIDAFIEALVDYRTSPAAHGT